MIWWKVILAILLGYALGNIQPGLWLTRRVAKTDLRTVGSGSTGATNTLRVLGWKFGLLTFSVDFFKGLLAVLLSRLILGNEVCMISGLFVVVGHIWPAAHHFKGGKGVATAFGALTLITPLFALIILIAGVAMIAATRFVSLGSLTATALYGILGVIRSLRTDDWGLLIFSIAAPVLIFYAHRANLARLAKGNENKLSFHKKG